MQDVANLPPGPGGARADNLADLVRRAAARDGGQRPALYWHDRRITWAQLDAQVDAVAAALGRLTASERVADGGAASGVPPRVAIALPNVPEFAAVYFGTLRAGLVAVPVNPGFTGRELRQILQDSGATVLVGTPAVLDAVDAEPGEQLPLRYSYVLGEPTAEPAPAAGDPSSPWRRPFARLMPRQAPDGAMTPSATGEVPRVEAPTGGEDLALLLYTSGTSGAPKGAMLSHRAMIANQAQLAAIEPTPMGPDDVVLLTLPLFHSYGLGTGLGAVAYHGAAGVLVERFDPADTLAQIVRHRVTAVIGVPPMFVAWSLMGEQLTRAFSWVRIAVSGAAPLDPATAARFAKATGHPVYEGYGLTETAPVLTSTMGQAAPKIGSIGRPLPQVEIRLVDANGEDVDLDISDEDDLEHDAPATPGTDPGEIVARGPNLFSGYWPDGRGGPDADGWWATGDVAYADGEGDLFLVDRLGELIIVSGFNVYPREVELVLTTHPSVLEAAAVAAAHPYTGQTVRAYVVLAADATVTAEELIGHCERNLARFKCPTAIEFVPQLPRTATGKVRKSELDRRYG